jgi:hypothetical protein
VVERFRLGGNRIDNFVNRGDVGYSVHSPVMMARPSLQLLSSGVDMEVYYTVIEGCRHSCYLFSVGPKSTIENGEQRNRT